MLLSEYYTTLIIKSKSKQPNPSIASYYYDINIKILHPPCPASQPASQPPTPALQACLSISVDEALARLRAFIRYSSPLESPPSTLGFAPSVPTSLPALPPWGGPPLSLPRLGYSSITHSPSEPSSNSSFRTLNPL